METRMIIQKLFYPIVNYILEKEEIYPDEDGSALIFVMWLLKHQVPL